MLEEVLRHLNNWFLVPDGIHSDTFTVQDGGITLQNVRTVLEAGADVVVSGSAVFADPASNTEAFMKILREE